MRRCASKPDNLPAATHWADARTGETFAGGQTITTRAPLDRIPAFWREGSHWVFRFQRYDLLIRVPGGINTES